MVQLAGRVGVILGGAAVHRGFPFQAPLLPSGRFSLEIGTEPGQLVFETPLHVPGTLRELGQHRRVDVLHLGDPLHRLEPPDTEAAGQFGA